MLPATSPSTVTVWTSTVGSPRTLVVQWVMKRSRSREGKLATRAASGSSWCSKKTSRSASSTPRSPTSSMPASLAPGADRVRFEERSGGQPGRPLPLGWKTARKPADYSLGTGLVPTRRREVRVEVTATAWVATIAVIVVLLGVDLAVGALRPHAVGFAEATAWSVFYVAVALAFGVVLGLVAGWDLVSQYLAGYLVEKSLSVDNLFVFVVIMTTFAVPAEHQQKALTFGIVLALVMRAAFIAVGAALLQLFSFMFLVFGLLLIWTAVQLYRHRDEDPEVEDNALVRLTRRLLPSTTRAGWSPGSAAGGRSPRCSSSWSPSAAPTCCSRWTPSRRCSGSPRSPTWSSPPTPSPCSACGRCSSWSRGCSTGWCTCPPAWPSCSCSSASSWRCTGATPCRTPSPRS